MLHPTDPLALTDGGQILFMPCPGTKGVPLDQSIEQLSQAGVAAILSTTPTAEMEKLEVTDLPQQCAANGIEWFHLPIPDDAGPGAEFESAWDQAKDGVLALLNQGKTIAIHCKGGSGRTGMMAALVLLARGESLDKVIADVQSLRPKALTHPVQLEYVSSYANR